MTEPEESQRWPGPISDPDPTGIARPRVAIAGIGIESSTFSPYRVGDDAFTVLRGEAQFARYPFLTPDSAERQAAEWIPVLRATSIPGGPVRADTYERLAREIEEGLRGQLPLDAVWLDLHGAMSVEGFTDAEGDLAHRVRRIVGEDCHVAASMDLHGNVSEQFSTALDYLTCYRMAPHEDEDNTRARTCHWILETLRGPHGSDPSRRRRWKAIVDVPVLLSGEQTSTRVEPARSLYGQLRQIEQVEGIDDASIWIGYAWADEPRCHAVVGTMGTDPQACRREAERLAGEIWDAREGFGFVGPTATLSECLDQAQKDAPALPGPFVISDSGDNPTAGGAGDATWSLAQVLSHPVSADPGIETVYASVADAAAVEQCERLGLGQRYRGTIGAVIDDRTAPPAEIDARIECLATDPVGGRSAVLRSGSVRVVVTSRRKPFHLLRDFETVGVDPRSIDVLVVKMGYLVPEVHELSAKWMLALTPGGVDQDVLRLGHSRLSRPIYPFDADMARPPLTARLERNNS